MLSHLYARTSRAACHSPVPAIGEPLESRRLMSSATTVTEVPFLGGTQLRVTGTDGDDQINVRFDPGLGFVVTNTADASVTMYGGEVKTVRVDGGAGNDTITMDWTVGRRTYLFGGEGDDTLTGCRADDYLNGGAGTNSLDGGLGDDVLVTVGGAVTDKLTGGEGTDSFWLDSKKTEIITDLAPAETLAGNVHRVASFFSRVKDPAARTALGNVSLANSDLPDPAVTADYAFTYANFADNYPLFGELGPRADDVVQGAVGDCYSMVVFSSVAAINPGKIRQSVVDLGDGTYAVQFRRGSARYYVRVDADLPVYPGTGDDARGGGGVPAYAGLGAQDSLWVALMEKAHAVVRTPAGGYQGLQAGWMRESYGLLGSKSKSFWTNSAELLMRTIQVLLGANRSVTFGTDQPAAGTPLLSGHAYTVVGVDTDGAGNAIALHLRNPWGEDGAGNDGSDDGYLTVTPQQALGALAGVCTAVV